MNWRDNYRAQFAFAHKDYLLSIEKYIQEVLPDCQSTEINGAIDILGREWPERWPPRGVHILDAIIQKRADVTGGKAMPGRLAPLMERMKGETPQQRWATICEPMEWPGKDWDNEGACHKLERYAEANGLEFERLDLSGLIAGTNALVCVEDDADWEQRKRQAHALADGGTE